jgi:hypothetical protein
MQRFLENKFAFAAIALAFALALGWNATQGTGMLFPGHRMLMPELITVAHGPILPPDPWDPPSPPSGGGSLFAHGPILPPDPWDPPSPPSGGGSLNA